VITTAAEYVGVLNIPNLDSSTPSPEWEELESIAEQYEREYVNALLGYAAPDFLANITDGGKWQALADGDTFTYDGRTYQFIGVRKLLAYFIYFEWARQHQVQRGMDGAVDPQYQNATSADMTGYAVNAWNRGVTLSGCQDDVRIETLFMYLTYKGEDFGDWGIDPVRIDYINSVFA